MNGIRINLHASIPSFPYPRQMHETSYNPTQISLVTRQLHSAIVADKESMAYFLLLTICVLLHFDTTSSLQASTVRELSGLYSNTKHYVSAVNFNGSAADPSFQNVSQACQNAILGLKNSSRVAAKCKLGYCFVHV